MQSNEKLLKSLHQWTQQAYIQGDLKASSNLKINSIFESKFIVNLQLSFVSVNIKVMLTLLLGAFSVEPNTLYYFSPIFNCCAGQ
jgi:ABC-type dipeptide/oligopeptide/nickel transport system permease component